MAALDLAKIGRFSIGFLVLILDQAIKRWLILAKPNVITLNYAAAWGMGEDLSTWIAIAGWVVLLFVLIAMWRRLGHVPALPAGLLFFGALSNSIDRIFSGAVIDYIRIGPIPPFNLADVAIVAGSVYLILTLLGKEKAA